MSELEIRVATRKQDLISEIVELKMGSRLGAVQTIDRLKAQLSELAHILKQGGDRTTRRLNEWLASS
jgi:hypothetical protein